MEIKNYYHFGSRLSSATFQAHAVNLNENKKGLDDRWKLLVGNYAAIAFPVLFKQEQGSKLHDVLDTGWPSLFLISDKMKTVMEENELTGWKAFPIKVNDKKGNDIKGYHGLSVTGRCGPIDYNKSEIIEKTMIDGGPISKYYKGLYVGLDEWDGSDFFLPRGLFMGIVTRKAMEAIKKAKLTNIRFENLLEIETWEATVSSHQEGMAKNFSFF